MNHVERELQADRTRTITWHDPMIGAEAAKGLAGLESGLFSAGVFSAGVFSVGVFSIGIFSVGVFSLGLFPVGLFALGLFAIGRYQRTLKDSSGL